MSALSGSFRTFHPELVLGIVSHMDECIAPALTVLVPASTFSMIGIAEGYSGTDPIAFAWTHSSIPEEWQKRRYLALSGLNSGDCWDSEPVVARGCVHQLQV